MSTTQVFPIVSATYRWTLVFSSIVALGAIGLLVFFPLRLGVDFRGGAVYEFSTTQESVSLESIRSSVPASVSPDALRSLGSNRYALSYGSLGDEAKRALTASLSASLNGFRAQQFLEIGPVVGQELIIKTVVAILLSSICIALYLGRRFQSTALGVTAVIATVHDVLIVLGAFGLFGRLYGVEIDTLFVTAMLTIISFSVHDTVVVYDRVRERRLLGVRFQEFLNGVDDAVRATLTRSLRNSLAIIIVLLSLTILGGATVRWFVVALLIGTIAGTYSSTFVAIPLLIVWKKYFSRSGAGRR